MVDVMANALKYASPVSPMGIFTHTFLYMHGYYNYHGIGSIPILYMAKNDKNCLEWVFLSIPLLNLRPWTTQQSVNMGIIPTCHVFLWHSWSYCRCFTLQKDRAPPKY